MTRLPYPVSAPRLGHRPRVGRGAFWLILLSHLVLFGLLALSLRWNVLQARDHSSVLRVVYESGVVDGLMRARAIFILEALQQEHIEEETTNEPGEIASKL
jgi:hypothetical protein